MGERRKNIRRTVLFMLVSAFLLTIAFFIFGVSENPVQNLAIGLAVGAISGLVTCAAVCKIGDKLMPEADVRRSRTGVITSAIIGGYVDLMVTSILVTLALTIIGVINDVPAPFLWGALVSCLGGWIAGALVGGIIGASWERV
jgi:hypothetical protein